MKKILILCILLSSCTVIHDEIEPVKWWNQSECVDQYEITDYQTIYRFCWVVELEKEGKIIQLNKCMFSSCEIVQHINQNYKNYKIKNIKKYKS